MSLGDTGQSEPTQQVMMAAEVLGVPYEKCSCSRGTSHEPYGITLGGSTGTWNTGFSTWEAAQNLRDQVLGLGGTLYTPPITDLTLLDMNEDGVFLKSDPTKKYTYTQVYAKIPVSSCTELVGYSYRRAPNGSCVPKETGASVASLDVDTETGMISNVKIAVAAQVGRVMNPKVQYNQSNMGACKGAHAALITDNVTDIPTGKNLTYNWIYYPTPTILEYDCTMESPELYGDESHPFGAKANSEGNPNPHGAACANAVYNAIGVRMTNLPITPAKILKAMGKI
jgi:CO/xanthine dehydrogenase Mo-binding subunit